MLENVLTVNFRKALLMCATVPIKQISMSNLEVCIKTAISLVLIGNFETFFQIMKAKFYCPRCYVCHVTLDRYAACDSEGVIYSILKLTLPEGTQIVQSHLELS